jgi:glycosyltransferase 2 family protein
MKKILLTTLQYLFFFGFGFFIIYQMLHELSANDKGNLIRAIQHINYLYLLPIFVIGVLSHVFRAMRWQLLLEAIELTPTLVNTSFAVFIGYFVNLGIPRAGEVAKCTVLAKYEKVPPHKLVGTIVAERAFDLVCLILLWVIAIVAQNNIIHSYLMVFLQKVNTLFRQQSGKLAIIVAVIVIGAIVAVVLSKKFSTNKLVHFIKETGKGVLSIRYLKKKWQFLGFTVLIWLMYLLQVYFGFLGITGLGVYNLSLLTALVVLVYGSVGIIVTPGGIGLYTLLVAEILEVYGVDKINAEAFGWVAWAAQTAVIIILGCFSFASIHFYNSKLNGKNTVGK